MDLQNLLRREIGEGMTEEQIASTVGVPLRALTDILTGKHPQSRAIWDKFARYFRMDAEFLRTGESTSRSAAGRIRRVPLLNWHELARLENRGNLPDVIHAETMVEATDIAGARTFALKVQDDSMEPIFREGEMIFVNPDAKWGPGDYVIAVHQGMSMATTILRQVNALSLAEADVVVGKIVRLRKNL